MIQPNFDPILIQDIARDLWERTRTHQVILGVTPSFPWEQIPEVQRIAMCRAVEEVLEEVKPLVKERNNLNY